MHWRALVLSAFSAMLMVAQSPPRLPPLPQKILLWPQGAPGALGNTEADQPLVIAYPIGGSQRVRTAVIVFPGGGYVNLALDYEGTQVAEWLNTYGISAFVLRYRLGPKYHHPVELGDAQRAIRWVRAHAGDYGYDPNRIGIWGFSAGGHLASSASTHFDAGNPASPDPVDTQSSRPDFAILAYPVITFVNEPYVHVGSRTALLGQRYDPGIAELLSNEKHVTKDTPPTFLFHTSDDDVVPVQNSILYYLALRAAGVPAEMHVYQHGRHGVGLARDIPELSSWPDQLAAWLKANHWR